ncbi:restriction endonuclease subunit S [Bradyrhizobium sp. 146]|uniref:restriction endonuclease subunit S n=1 Tax=Bradyrhizobium sp. 146 TaxID=2782622 RepID=UPI001FF919D7|nr:restriction endonuclease subunit S [Bradyrhizobium sp. 146]MCK1702605.1 restriction endonuclease subunit S [Bradyrhizobium sp. 146]
MVMAEAAAALVTDVHAQEQGLSEGYKQTEVGPIPDEWQVGYIEDIAIIATGGRNTQDRVDDGHYPFFVRSQKVERINTYSFDGEAVLTAGDGVGTGKIFHYIKGKCDIHQRVYRISDFAEGINGYYFFLYFSANFYGRIMQMTAKSSVDSVRREMIARMPIALPPKSEQEAIASAVFDTEQLIESFESLIAKKRATAQGAMQDLLTGKRRLPGFNEEWSEQPLGVIAPLQRGFDLPNSRLREGPYPVVYSNGIINHHDEFQVKGPGVVTGRSGTLGAVTYVKDNYWPHNTTLWVTSFGQNDPRFIGFLYSWIGFERFASGSGVPTLNRNDAHAFKVRIPPSSDEQKAIAGLLQDIDADISELEKRLAKARQIKQGMMQELLTGKVRFV